jgi:hypothetical protein
MDGHPRQNPAYRPATEKALETGLFLWTRLAGDSSGSPRGGLTAVSVEPLGAVARRGHAGRAGYEPLRGPEATRPPDRSQGDLERRSQPLLHGLDSALSFAAAR